MAAANSTTFDIFSRNSQQEEKKVHKNYDEPLVVQARSPVENKVINFHAEEMTSDVKEKIGDADTAEKVMEE